jgi:hypothetical protein
MHKFLIYLSVYFCLTCFGLSFSPSSEAGVQLRQWFKSAGYGVSARTLTPYPRDNSVSACMEQRVAIKFLVDEGVKPADIYRRLKAQYGDRRSAAVRHLNGVNVSNMAVRPLVTIPGRGGSMHALTLPS